MFVAASSHCFAEMPFFDACQQLTDLEYNRVEIWLSEESDHLKPSRVIADPDAFFSDYRESTRLTPTALSLADDVDADTLYKLGRLCKLLKITQITVPASPLGTPFNLEIDRLRKYVEVTSPDGVRVSIKTQTGHLTEDPQTAIELCQSVKGLGITLDPSYYICGPHRNKSFDSIYPYVYHVQLRDTSPDQVQVQVGLGEVDYNRMISLLAKCDYKLALSVELLPQLLDLENRPLEMRKLRMLLDSLL